MQSIDYTTIPGSAVSRRFAVHYSKCYNEHVTDIRSDAHRRMTKIVCTIGPASASLPVMESLARNGMDIARLNLSHGTYDQHRTTVAAIRKLCDAGPYCIGIMFDTKGAEIRTGLRPSPLAVTEGDEILFVEEGKARSPADIEVNYGAFASDVRETDRILIDNGELAFGIVRILPDGSVLGRAQQSGTIGSRRHINLPGADLDLPPLTADDWKDIAFAIEQGADFLALSFIRTADDVRAVRAFVRERKGGIQIIAKIETRQSVENIAEILNVSDGIMVARGDLGAEVPFEDVFVIQNELVARCRDAGKPVIVATHMLESMTEHPMPTRAEVTDVAHAAELGADATMLSGETASGKHPALAVEAMRRIIVATEEYGQRFRTAYPAAVHNEQEAQAEAAVSLADASGADALVVFTREGNTARVVSKFRPRVPVIAVTSSAETQRRVKLYYGVTPVVVTFSDPESTVQAGLRAAKEAGLIHTGERAVLISDSEAKDAPVSTVQMREIA